MKRIIIYKLVKVFKTCISNCMVIYEFITVNLLKFKLQLEIGDDITSTVLKPVSFPKSVYTSLFLICLIFKQRYEDKQYNDLFKLFAFIIKLFEFFLLCHTLGEHVWKEGEKADSRVATVSKGRCPPG